MTVYTNKAYAEYIAKYADGTTTTGIVTLTHYEAIFTPEREIANAIKEQIPDAYSIRVKVYEAGKNMAYTYIYDGNIPLC